MMRRYASSVSASSGLPSYGSRPWLVEMPALRKAMSNGPATVTTRSHASGSVTSSIENVPPIRSATEAPPASSMSVTTTSAPASAMAIAVALPMPLAPPVTIARRSASSVTLNPLLTSTSRAGRSPRRRSGRRDTATDRLRSRPMGHTIRELRPADQAFVTEMQYAALFVPEGEDPPPREVLEQPAIRRYHADFGHRPGDAGAIAEGEGGRPLGAVWARQLEGYGFVDHETPELGIAVVADRRGEGLGGALLTCLLERVPRCSLCVDDRNPAMRLYERHGFRPVRRDGDHAVLMVRGGRR